MLTIQSRSLSVSYSIVIPAYNEENRIANTIMELEGNIPEIMEIIVVFDGTDNTSLEALRAGNKVRVLRYENRLGKGKAVLEGFRAAKGEIVCFVDADGSAPWNEVRNICSKVSDNNPAAVGSRWIRTSKVNKNEPLLNRFSSRVFHYLVFATLGISVKDTQCGLKAFTNTLAKILVDRVVITNRTFDVALLYHLKKMRIMPLEVGIEWTHNSDTRMPILKVMPMMFMTIVGLRLRHSDKISLSTVEKLEKIREELEFY